MFETEEIHARLTVHRQITIVGGPGVGKSCFLRHLANEFEGDYVLHDVRGSDEESFWIGLFRDLCREKWPDEMYSDACERILGLGTTTLFLDAKASQGVWLRGVVQRLLDSCEHLRVVVANSGRLRVRGENVFKLHGLSTEADVNDFDSVAECDSVQLFCHFAAHADPSFALTESTKDHVLSICLILEGNPLLIELAAARLASSTVAQLRSRLPDRLRYFARKETGTAKATRLEQLLALQFQELDADGRRLFLDLSACKGAFSVDIARLIRPEMEDIDSVFERLVDAAWIKQADFGQESKWFYIDETLSLFGSALFNAEAKAQERLREIRDILVGVLQEALRSASPEATRQLPEIRRALMLDAKVAVEDDLTRDPINPDLRRIFDLVALFYDHGMIGELRGLVRSALAFKAIRSSPHYLRLMNALAVIETTERQYRAAGQVAVMCCFEARRAGNAQVLAAALSTLGRCAYMVGAKTTWKLHCRQARLNRKAGNSAAELLALSNGVGTLERQQVWAPHPEIDRLRELIAESTDHGMVATASVNLAEYHAHRGEFQTAFELCRRGIKIHHERGSHLPLEHAVRLSAWITAEFSSERAAFLFGLSRQLQANLPESASPIESKFNEVETIEHLKSALGEARAEVLMDEGEASSMQYAFEHWID